eukprot:14700_1
MNSGFVTLPVVSHGTRKSRRQSKKSSKAQEIETTAQNTTIRPKTNTQNTTTRPTSIWNVKKEQRTQNKSKTKLTESLKRTPRHHEEFPLLSSVSKIKHKSQPIYTQQNIQSKHVNDHEQLQVSGLSSRSTGYRPPKILTALLTPNVSKLSIKNDEICDGYDCCQLLRVVNGLRYYEKSLPDRSCQFMQFCDQYTMCLDDYVHFICSHSHHLNNIVDHFKLIICEDVNKCGSIQRHYTSRNRKNNDDEQNIYFDTFDSIHFCLFHLQDFALRIYRNDNDDNYHEKDQKCAHDVLDKDIAFIQNEIETNQNKYQHTFDRLNNNNKKFIIQQIENVKEYNYHKNERDGAMMFTDEMLNFIFDAIDFKKEEKYFNYIVMFMKSEEYD